MAPGAGFEIDADRFRSGRLERTGSRREPRRPQPDRFSEAGPILGSKEQQDRKSTRLNSSHGYISYAVFCLKKKKAIESVPSFAADANQAAMLELAHFLIAALVFSLALAFIREFVCRDDDGQIASAQCVRHI